MEKLDRSRKLFALLIYATKKKGYLSITDRILINQERGRLMANETALNNEDVIPFPKKYKYPKELKAKIKFLETKIENDQNLLFEILSQINEVCN